MRRLVLLAAVLGLVVSCGGSVPGAPVPATTAASARPKDIRLDGIDPCSVFTPAVRQALRIDRPPTYDKGSDPIYRGEVPSCGSRGSQRPLFSITLVFGLQDGIELFAPDRVAGTVTATKVRDFPAVLLRPSRTADNCGLIVDTGPGQSISFIYTDDGNTPPVAQDRLCADVEQAADLMVAELLRHA